MSKNNVIYMLRGLYQAVKGRPDTQERKKISKPPTIPTTGENFPKPIALEGVLRPVKRLEEDMLPESIKQWAIDVSYRMQSPVDYVATSAIIAISSVIGTACAVRPKQYDDWTVIPNLWGAIIGNPSALKSPSMKEAMRFLEQLQEDAKNEYERKLTIFNLSKDSIQEKQNEIETRITNLKNDSTQNEYMISELESEYCLLAELKEPILRIFKTNESTMQSQTELQKTNPRGILTFRDELTGLLTRWNRKENEEERAYFLDAWNGNASYTDYKIGRGLTDTPNVCISLFGGIQPDKLKDYLEKTIKGGNDGLLQRFQLAVYPDEKDIWNLVDILPNKQEKERLFKIFKYLSDADFTKFGAISEDSKFPYLRFNEGSQVLFNGWITNLQNNKIKNERNSYMAEHLTKFRSLMPSLALIFHLIDKADTPQDFEMISEKSTHLAIRWCDYLESHARRIYALVDTNSHKLAAAEVLSRKLRSEIITTEFSVRDIHRKGWATLTELAIVTSACNILEMANWIIPLPAEAKKGRPSSPKYMVNPLIYEHNAE